MLTSGFPTDRVSHVNVTSENLAPSEEPAEIGALPVEDEADVLAAEAAIDPEPAVFDPQAEEPDEDPPSASEALRYFGADFDVDGLVRRLNKDDFVIPNFDPEASTATGFHGFQRKFVWTKKQMDRFIESLLLGYPVPGIFLVEQPDRRYLVLDGQQRLRTLQAFMEGTYSVDGVLKAFVLQNVAKEFHGATYKSLKDTDRRVLDNTFIQATVVVPKGESGKQGVYQLFERINSSGTNLQPQEIRVALFAGPKIELLRQLNHVDPWRQLFGPIHRRLKDNELILRHLALLPVAEVLQRFAWDSDAAKAALDSDELETGVYKSPMGTFLNTYLDSGTSLSIEPTKERFTQACQTILSAIGAGALRLGSSGQVNAAHTDALLTGVSLGTPEVLENEGLVLDRFNELVATKAYIDAVSGSTSHASSVNSRLTLAVQAFS